MFVGKSQNRFLMEVNLEDGTFQIALEVSTSIGAFPDNPSLIATFINVFTSAYVSI